MNILRKYVFISEVTLCIKNDSLKQKIHDGLEIQFASANGIIGVMIIESVEQVSKNDMRLRILIDTSFKRMFELEEHYLNLIETNLLHSIFYGKDDFDLMDMVVVKLRIPSMLSEVQTKSKKYRVYSDNDGDKYVLLKSEKNANFLSYPDDVIEKMLGV